MERKRFALKIPTCPLSHPGLGGSSAANLVPQFLLLEITEIVEIILA